MVELACTNSLYSYAGGSLATGRVTQAGEVEGKVPDENKHSVPQGWGFRIGPATELTEMISNSMKPKTNVINLINLYTDLTHLY